MKRLLIIWFAITPMLLGAYCSVNVQPLVISEVQKRATAFAAGEYPDLIISEMLYVTPFMTPTATYNPTAIHLETPRATDFANDITPVTTSNPNATNSPPNPTADNQPSNGGTPASTQGVPVTPVTAGTPVAGTPTPGSTLMPTATPNNTIVASPTRPDNNNPTTTPRPNSTPTPRPDDPTTTPNPTDTPLAQPNTSTPVIISPTPTTPIPTPTDSSTSTPTDVPTATPDLPTIYFTASKFTVMENQTSLLTVTLSHASDKFISVGYEIINTNQNTALAGADYEAFTIGSLGFAPDATGKTPTQVTFTWSELINDSQVEPNKTLQFRLLDPPTNAILGKPFTTTLTIVNDDLQ